VEPRSPRAWRPRDNDDAWVQELRELEEAERLLWRNQTDFNRLLLWEVPDAIAEVEAWLKRARELGLDS
jgi:hypothetical protein